ncbi:MAG: hypothetical protein K0R29_2221 [Pseudobdellovibrio sp.]|nr:hypothetical protein [Pseudobdellovibrio sp.]
MFLLASVVPLVILFVFQLRLFNEQIKSGQLSELPETHPYFVFMNTFQSQFMNMFGLAVLASVITCFILGVIVSHRVAGPLVKITDHFDRIADGTEEDKEIKFREGDFFHDLAKSYNKRLKNVK